MLMSILKKNRSSHRLIIVLFVVAIQAPLLVIKIFRSGANFDFLAPRAFYPRGTSSIMMQMHLLAALWKYHRFMLLRGRS